MFDRFWPSFFGAIIAMVVIVGLARPELMEAAMLAVGGFLILVAWVFLAGLVGSGVLFGYIVYTRYSADGRRAVDGQFPMIKKRTRYGTTWVNPNLALGSAFMIANNGQVSELDTGVSEDAKRDVRRWVEASNLWRAIMPGDAARRTAHGAMSEVPRLPNNMLMDLERKREPARPMLEARPSANDGVDRQWSTTGEVRPLPTLTDGMRGNTRTRLVLGMVSNPEEDGDAVYYWDVAYNPHLRFHGRTQGAGKTTAIKTLLLGALEQGHRVVVADHRRHKDFGAWRKHASLVDINDTTCLAELLEWLVKVHRRTDNLLRDRNQPNVGDAERLFLLISEFGGVCQNAATDGTLDRINASLKIICQEAGACGIHLLFEDQLAEGWPRRVIGNTVPVVGSLPVNGAQQVGVYAASALAHHHFLVEGIEIETWDVARYEYSILERIPPARQLSLPVAGHGSGVYTSPPTRSERGVERGTERNVGTEDEGYWVDVVANWFTDNPSALSGSPRGVSDLARAMCLHQTGEIADYEQYKSRAHRLFHNFRKQVSVNGDESDGWGDNDALTGAERLAGMGIKWDDLQWRDGNRK